MKDGIYKSSTELCNLPTKKLQCNIFNHTEEVRKTGQTFTKGQKLKTASSQFSQCAQRNLKTETSE